MLLLTLVQSLSEASHIARQLPKLLSASPKFFFDDMSSFSSLSYPGKQYVDLIELMVIIPTDNDQRMAAEKSKRDFIEWKHFKPFMKRAERWVGLLASSISTDVFQA